MDAPEHDVMWELARKNDKELWRLETNVIACKQNSILAESPAAARTTVGSPLLDSLSSFLV